MIARPVRMVQHLPREARPRRLYRYAGGPAGRVADAMTWPAISVEASAFVRAATATLEETQLHFLPVVADGHLLGMTCRCRLTIVPGARRVVETVAVPSITVDLATPTSQAVAVMMANVLECLPVADEGRLFGVLTLGDVVRCGALDPADRPVCAACRARRHLARGPGEVPFCGDCRARSQPWTDDAYEELGGGD